MECSFNCRNNLGTFSRQKHSRYINFLSIILESLIESESNSFCHFCQCKAHGAKSCAVHHCYRDLEMKKYLQFNDVWTCSTMNLYTELSVRSGRDLIDGSTSIQMEYIIAQMVLPSIRSRPDLTDSSVIQLVMYYCLEKLIQESSCLFSL